MAMREQMTARRKILVADLLCGAGGSSTGCARALAELGLEMDLVCVNHWQTAIDTHTLNHPKARHVVQDIATVRPHILLPEGRLDLLMASPTCTHHSVARGGKPTSDQQRSDPWHIVTWLTELRVARIIIENVWEFTGWGPVDARTGRPIKARKGEYFRQWIATLRGLGFNVEWRKLNAADYGDATTRQRFILMGRSDGRPIVWPVPTHHRRADGLALFPGVQPWRPAREIIDWSIKGKSIFGRKKPLAPKTLARIHAGAVKFAWPEPFLVILRNHMDGKSIDDPAPTIAAGGQHIGLAEPFVLSRQGAGAPRSVDEPVPGMTMKHSHCLVTSYYGASTGAQSVRAPLPTITTKDRFGVVVPAVILTGHGEREGQAPRFHSADDPAPTVTSQGLGLAVPVTHEGGLNRAYSVDAPLPTIATGNRGSEGLAQGVITPVFDGERYDITFRMLEPHELAAAMGFDAGGGRYEFAGTKKEKIKQIGNAVSVAKMKACVGAIMADAARREPEAATQPSASPSAHPANAKSRPVSRAASLSRLYGAAY